MRIKELRELIADLPDDSYVLTPTSDHQYHLANLTFKTVMQQRFSRWEEDFGEEHTPEGEYGKRVQALIVD